MKIYTKHGDAGMTTLKSATQISKADDRIATLGTIDELTSQMGLAKAYIASMRTADSDTCVEHFDRVQTTLMTIMAGIADPRNKQFEVSAQETSNPLAAKNSNIAPPPFFFYKHYIITFKAMGKRSFFIRGFVLLYFL